MYSLSVGLHALLEDKSIRLAGRSVRLLDLANLVILALLVVDIYTVPSDRILWMKAGD